MVRVFIVVIFGMSFMSPLGHAASKKSAVQPLSFALLVGNNKGAAHDTPLKYAQNDTVRLYRVLKELGGYHPQRMWLLLGKSSSEVKTTFQKIHKKIKQAQKAHPGRSTILLFYYSGHADPRALHLGKTTLEFQKIRSLLKSSKAQVRLGILDTCQSGSMIRKKGARRVPRKTPLPPIIRNLSTAGQAVITSSGSGEDSHEIEQLRASVFTHYLLSGLRGAADQNKDNRVTLNEVYSYAYQRTKTHTLFLSSGIQHPSFRNELRGHGQLVLTHIKRASAQLRFGPGLQGRYYLLNQERNLLLAELAKKKGRSVSIGLAAGSYTLLKRDSRSYRLQQIRLKSGKKHDVKPKKMQAISYKGAASKGLRWLTHSGNKPKKISSGYRTAFYVSLSATLISLASTGICYGLANSYISQHDTELNQPGGTGKSNESLLQTSRNLNTGAIVSLGAALAGGIAATVFYAIHKSKYRANPLPKLQGPKPLPKLDNSKTLPPSQKVLFSFQ
mgnify:CR=1 FL=1